MGADPEPTPPPRISADWAAVAVAAVLVLPTITFLVKSC